MLINSMNEYNNEIEYKINKCNTETECKLSSVVMTIEKMSQNIDEHKNNVDIKVNEIESTCKTDIQSIQETVDVIEHVNHNKFESIEQNISSVKDELSLVINQKLSNVTERMNTYLSKRNTSILLEQN